MRLENIARSDGGGRLASQVYWNALRKLRDAWREVFHEELEAEGSLAMETYESALRNFKTRLLKYPSTKQQQILAVLDVQKGEDVEEVLLGSADLDDLTPNQIKDAIYAEVMDLGKGRFELRPILRAALDLLYDKAKTRRPRVGPNRHWPRLLQYLRELEDETDYSPDGRGFRLANAGGRGPVAQYPRDPGLLSVVIDPDYL